jgi:hypothetical protein
MNILALCVCGLAFMFVLNGLVMLSVLSRLDRLEIKGELKPKDQK